MAAGLHRGVFRVVRMDRRPMTDQEWCCVCRFPDGSTETTIWMTQDGADQMADETEQEGKRKGLKVVCEITPAGA
jgi:hypothetical protein